MSANSNCELGHFVMRFLMLCAIAVMCSCTTAGTQHKPSHPSVVPDGWITDYDYDSGMRSYLRRQYDSARLEGATAYVYIYSDKNSYCRRLRRAMGDERISLVLRDARVSMLDFWRLKRTYAVSPENALDPGNFSATFVKISMDGDLTDEVFHMRVYMYLQDVYYEGGIYDHIPSLGLPPIFLTPRLGG